MRPFRFIAEAVAVTGLADLTEKARRAEGLGIDVLSITDHLIDQLAPIPAMASIAAVTDRLRVGTFVLNNDLRHPAILAQDLASIDVLSGGRLEIGIGAGWNRAEYDAIGLAFDPVGTRVARLAESIAVLKGLFAEGPFTFKGEHYRIAGYDARPKPIQRPHPPLMIGGGGRRVLSLAGREADIVSLAPRTLANQRTDPRSLTFAATAEKVAWVRAAAGDRIRSARAQHLSLGRTGHRDRPRSGRGAHGRGSAHRPDGPRAECRRGSRVAPDLHRLDRRPGGQVPARSRGARHLVLHDRRGGRAGSPGRQAAMNDSLWSPERRALSIGLILTITLVAFESLAVSTVMPIVEGELGMPELYGWVFSAFFLGNLIGIVVVGGLIDRGSLVPPFLAGLGLFAIGLLIDGLTPSMPVLVGGRLLQGLGGGAIPPTAYVAIGRSMPEFLRPRMFATLSTAWVLPGIVGPAIAGLVGEHLHWRFVFLGLAAAHRPGRRPDPAVIGGRARGPERRRALRRPRLLPAPAMGDHGRPRSRPGPGRAVVGLAGRPRRRPGLGGAARARGGAPAHPEGHDSRRERAAGDDPAAGHADVRVLRDGRVRDPGARAVARSRRVGRRDRADGCDRVVDVGGLAPGPPDRPARCSATGACGLPDDRAGGRAVRQRARPRPAGRGRAWPVGLSPDWAWAWPTRRCR